jgi:hypothetical protein
LSDASVDDLPAAAPTTGRPPEGAAGGEEIATAKTPAGGPPAASRGAGPPARGRRTWGKVARDGLLLFVVLAMSLPFIVSQFGRVGLSAHETQLAATARRAAMRQDDWLTNSLSNKTASVDRLPGGDLRFRQDYYTFFGVPWGWSRVTVDAQGRVVQIDTKLTVSGTVRSGRPSL